MNYIITSLLVTSVTISFVALVYMALDPLIGKQYKTKTRYYAWLPIIIAFLVPFNIKGDKALVKIPVPAKAPIVQNAGSSIPSSFTGDKIQTIPLGTAEKEAIKPQGNLVEEIIGNQRQEEALVRESEEEYRENKGQITEMEGANQNIKKVISQGKSIIKSDVGAIFWWSWAFGLWLLGAGVYIGYALYRHMRFLAMLRRWREPVKDPLTLIILENIKTEMNIRRPVDLYTCAFIGSPMIIGFIKPMILLPDRPIENEEMSFVIKHELTHFMRGDLWYKALVLVASALHWFNPLMGLISKNINILCEISCDDEVVKHRGEEIRRQYSQTIIGLMKNQSKWQTRLSTNFNGGKKGMKKRILSIMDMGKKKAGALLIAFVFVLTLGASFAVSAQTGEEEGIKEEKVYEEAEPIASDDDLYWYYDTEMVKNAIEAKGWEKIDFSIKIDVYDQPKKSINDDYKTGATLGMGNAFGYVEKMGAILEIRFTDGEKIVFGPYDSKEALQEELGPYFEKQIGAGRITQDEVDLIFANYDRPDTIFNQKNLLMKDQVNMDYFEDKIKDMGLYYIESQKYYQSIPFHYRHIKNIGDTYSEKPADNPDRIDGYDLVVYFALPEELKNLGIFIEGELGYVGPYETKEDLLVNAALYLHKQVELEKLTRQEADDILAQLKKEKTASDRLSEELGKENMAWHEEKIDGGGTFSFKNYRYNQQGNFVEKSKETFNPEGETAQEEEKIKKLEGYKLTIEYYTGTPGVIGPYSTMEEFTAKTAFYLQEQVNKEKMTQEQMDMVLYEIQTPMLPQITWEENWLAQRNEQWYEGRGEDYYLQILSYDQGRNYAEEILVGIGEEEKRDTEKNFPAGYLFTIDYTQGHEGYSGPYNTREELMEKTGEYLQNQLKEGRLNQWDVDKIMEEIEKDGLNFIPLGDENHPGYSPADYEKLMALNTQDYEQMTLEAFDEKVKPLLHLFTGFGPGDENRAFMASLLYAKEELEAAENKEEPALSLVASTNKKGMDGVEYGANLEYTIHWNIADKMALTAKQRNNLLNDFQRDVQKKLDYQTLEELMDSEIKSKITKEINEEHQLLKEFFGITITFEIENILIEVK